MAPFTHAVSVAAPPATVFPWLVDEDKIRRWTDGIDGYEIVGGGPAALGKHVRVTLTVSGHALTLDQEIVAFEPPTTLAMRAESKGLGVASTYRVEPEGEGARVTQTVDLEAKGMTAKLLAPTVRKHMEAKFEADLGRLREALG